MGKEEEEDTRRGGGLEGMESGRGEKAGARFIGSRTSLGILRTIG